MQMSVMGFWCGDIVLSAAMGTNLGGIKRTNPGAITGAFWQTSARADAVLMNVGQAGN
jgi:hypothetical protein